ncbi:MAG: hypothetical protein R2761_23400 [Acidimicrobiales bacterium]
MTGAGTSDGGDTGSGRGRAGVMAAVPDGLAAGLVLGPRALERPRDAGWAATGTLTGEARARVDQAGLVSPEAAGWSLDWWIGAEDRWYLPAREATVRQHRLGAGPVIETALRIPGGDARHRVYGALAGPVPVTVVEVENDSAVPVALALALRPYRVGGDGSAPGGFAGPLSLDGWPSPVGAAHHEPVAVRAGGAVLAVLPRPPAHAGAAAAGDLLASVEAGDDLRWTDGAVGPGASAVLLFPLPHRTTLRLLIPATAAAAGAARGGEAGRVGGVLDKVRGRRRPPAAAPPLPDPRAVAAADAVARGWASVLAAGARITVPDSGLGELADGARGRLLLAASDLGPRLASLASGAGDQLAALAFTGHHREVAAAAALLVDDLPPARRLPEPAAGADVLAALGLARSLATGPAGSVIAGSAVASLAAAGPGGGRAAGGSAAAGPGGEVASPLVDPARLARLVEWALMVLRVVERGGDSRATSRARAGAALLARAVDPAGAARLAADAVLLGGGSPAPGGAPGVAGSGGDGQIGTDDPLAAAHRLIVGPPATVDQVNELAAQASAAGVWGGAAGDDPAGAARYVAALRSLLVDDAGPGLSLLPGFPSSWRGGALEVHGLPTRHGAVSFAIRWHGYRPALLWEIAPGSGSTGPLPVRAPVLDAGWTATEARGEALLTGSGDELPAAPAPGEGFQ